jgi:hypothetical protein
MVGFQNTLSHGRHDGGKLTIDAFEILHNNMILLHKMELDNKIILDEFVNSIKNRIYLDMKKVVVSSVVINIVDGKAVKNLYSYDVVFTNQSAAEDYVKLAKEQDIEKKKNLAFDTNYNKLSSNEYKYDIIPLVINGFVKN